MFTVSKSLENALRLQDKREIRNALIGYIIADPRNHTGEASAAIRYVEKQGIDIWQPHDPSIPLEQDSQQWTLSYATDVTADLYRNFSKERFAHWEAVAREADRKSPLKTATPSVTPQAAHTSAQNDEHSDDTFKKIAIGVAAAVAVATVAAVVTILLK